MPRILILDDRATNRSLYARMANLAAPGIAVEPFANGLDALEWLESNTVDLIVTDFNMPEINGAEFTRRVRAMPQNQDVPIIVVTAYDGHALRYQAKDAGATEFLQNPIDHVEFVTRIQSMLALSTPMRRETSSAGVPPALISMMGQVMDALPARISISDSSGRCIYVNNPQAQEIGLPASELQGRDMALVYGENRATTAEARDRLVFETGKALPRYIEEVAAPSGNPRTVFISKAPLRDPEGTVIGVLTAAIDATDPEATPHILQVV